VSDRYLYLARHGDAEGGLTRAGRRQAELLAGRLAGVPFASVTHSPLPRAVPAPRQERSRPSEQALEFGSFS